MSLVVNYSAPREYGGFLNIFFPVTGTGDKVSDSSNGWMWCQRQWTLVLDSKGSWVACTRPIWQAMTIMIPFNGTWFRDRMGIMINDHDLLSTGAAVGKLKEVASWYHHEWVCGEILPHFDMHTIFVALKLRKMLKLADSFKMGLLANQK